MSSFLRFYSTQGDACVVLEITISTICRSL